MLFLYDSYVSFRTQLPALQEMQSTIKLDKYWNKFIYVNRSGICKHQNSAGGIGFYLTTNLVTIPYHAICDGDYKHDGQRFIIEEIDFALLELEQNPERGTAPLLSLGIQFPNLSSQDITFELVVESWDAMQLSNKVVQYAGKGGMFQFTFQNPLKSGESGMLIEGRLRAVHDEAVDKRKPEFTELHAPLFLVVARRRTDPNIGLGIYLPLAYELALKTTALVRPTLPEDMFMHWELITVPGEIKNQAMEKLFTKLALPKCPQFSSFDVNTLWAPNAPSAAAFAISGAKGYDRVFLQTKVWGSAVHKTVTMTNNLKANFIMAEESACAGQEDKCWVVRHEQSEGSTGMFELVCALAGEEGNFEKLDSAVAGAVEQYRIYTGSATPMALNAVAFETFRDLNVGALWRCHHPLLCELNDDCRGFKKDKDGKVYITHCCIRPSHLLYMNKPFNEYCKIIQKVELKRKATRPPLSAQKSLSISW